MSKRAEHVVGKVEPAVRQDVGFAAVQDDDLRIALAQTRDFVGLAFHAVDGQIP
jgi:hypothetical protein